MIILINKQIEENAISSISARKNWNLKHLYEWALVNVDNHNSNKKAQEKPIYKLTLKHKQRHYKSEMTTPPKINSRKIQTWKSERCIIHKKSSAPSIISSKPQNKQGYEQEEGQSINIVTSNIPMFATKHRKQISKFETLKEANDIVMEIRKSQGRNSQRDFHSNQLSKEEPNKIVTFEKSSSIQCPKKMHAGMHSISSPLNLLESSTQSQAMKIAVQKFMNKDLK